MRILTPNKTNSEIEYVSISNIYVYILDYGRKFLLREVKLEPGRHTWIWVPLETQHTIDISDFYNNNRVCSFNNAINRAINDMYCTVYEFKDIEEMIKCWKKIEYHSNITTVYKGTEISKKE